MIVGIGLVNKDIVAVVPSWERDVKTQATHFWEQVGGPVPVALQTIARLGYDAPITEGAGFLNNAICLITVTGFDQTARELLGRLDKSGVETHWCLTGRKNQAASVSLVLVDARDGSRTVANYADDLPPLNLARLPAQRGMLASAELLHIDGRDLPANLEAARIVREHGGTVSLDLGTMRPGREELFPLCDIIWASKKGGAGAFPQHADDPAAQVQGFLNCGAKIAGVTLGANGVVLGWRGGGETPVSLPAFFVEKPLDTCGAGDVFHGAFLWAHVNGQSPLDAARFAQAASALRIQAYGNEAGIPTREAVQVFLDGQPAQRL